MKVKAVGISRKELEQLYPEERMNSEAERLNRISDANRRTDELLEVLERIAADVSVLRVVLTQRASFAVSPPEVPNVLDPG